MESLSSRKEGATSSNCICRLPSVKGSTLKGEICSQMDHIFTFKNRPFLINEPAGRKAKSDSYKVSLSQTMVKKCVYSPPEGTCIHLKSFEATLQRSFI